MSTFYDGADLHGAPAPSPPTLYFRQTKYPPTTATRSGTFIAVLDPLKFWHHPASIINIVIHAREGTEWVSSPEHPSICDQQRSFSKLQGLYHEKQQFQPVGSLTVIPQQAQGLKPKTRGAV
ncbi:hypothetical protein DHEL01_v204121 [Diaporthe helianthi]|uniref:Uncharacterized protein n=1 Tax=Diaporthe helianthi TaxID=158607 RepID=A0A2P5I4L8_DIAHE|nr:hypothetical protein DHEL01_v204121 [Diaporthe helianthi]